MENSISNNIKDRSETSVDHQLICTICNKPFNDPQSLSCGHTFCQECIRQEIEENNVSCPTCQQGVTINNFPEVKHTVRKNVNNVQMEYNEDKQTTLHKQNIQDPINKVSSAIDGHNLSSNIALHQNEQQNQYSAARLFEPFRDLLSDLINENKQVKEEINQLKKQNQLQLNEQLKKNEKLQLELNKLTEKSEIQLNEQSRKNEELQIVVNQIREQNETQLTRQSKRNEELQFRISQLREQNRLQLTEQSRKNEDFQLAFNQLKEQGQLQHQTLTEQLKNVNNQYDICVKQFNDQSKKNEKLQLELDQLKEQSQLQLTEQSRKIEELQIGINQLNDKSTEYSTLIDRLQTDDQNQNAQILETNQQYNLLEINVKSIRNYMRYLPDTTWKQEAITSAGGNGRGNQLNQLYCPQGIFIDDDHTIYIADYSNHRIVEWKCNATNGQIVAGGNGYGNKMNQLNYPTDMIIDKENNSLIICDSDNRRVMRWSREKNTKNGEIIIENIDCSRLTMDKDGSLYVSDYKKDEVRRWKRGDKNGTIVAGGNGKGNHLNQLNYPTFIFVDEDYSLYVSDRYNHRVMKWMKDANEGIVVAGGNGKGNSLTKLSSPTGVIVDQLGQIYVADCENDRVMRWCKGAKEGTIVVGGNGQGKQSNQLNSPVGLSFDRRGNLYVADYENHRIQKFEIN